ncbi:MAG TPA: hypothetical protein VGJ54_09475 [Streptosporangiaceae bacterium]
MTADDRMAYKAQCEREAAALVAPEYRPAALPDHNSEVVAAHQGAPSVAEQSRTHGAPAPAVDKGPDPRGGAR